MKPLAVWFAVFGIVFGAVGVGYHLVLDANPDRVFVVVDTSFSMDPVWRDVPGVLDEIDDQRYAEFALATDKGPEHGWASELTLDPGLAPWAPRDLSAVAAYPEVDEATDLILVTNADPSETAGFDGWRIVRIDR